MNCSPPTVNTLKSEFKIAMRLQLDESEFLSVVANGVFKIDGTIQIVDWSK